MDYKKIIENQQLFFQQQHTKDIGYRKQALKRLRDEIIRQEGEIVKALYNDFRKAEYETLISETGVVLNELNLAIRKIHRWTRRKRVFPQLVNFPSSAFIYQEPVGSVLIMAPWNYPFQLSIAPLIGAVAAGNTVVLKPSEFSPSTSRIVSRIIAQVFNPAHVCVIDGDAMMASDLLKERWDYIFFTGSTRIGKLVARAAAEHLTPVTLELGGKSPCIVDETAAINLAAKRIVWGKFINCGQSCIAPDYVLVHVSVQDAFIEACKKEITLFYGEDVKKSPDYARVINRKNYKILCSLLENQKIIFGGAVDDVDCFISPTLILNPPLESPLMKEEIFGPVLPVLTYSTGKELYSIINSHEKPLSFYVFSRRKKFIKELLSNFSFGGGVINSTMEHIANHRLPFGGVGFSGMGKYHGKYSFDAFSNPKPVINHYNWLDIPLRYPPYNKSKALLKFLLKWLS